MSQCPSCNKFASLETEEPEVQSIEVDQDGRVTGSIRVFRTSSCCGDEMKEYVFDINADPTDEIDTHLEMHEQTGTEYELSVEEGSVESTERSQTTDRKGNKITNPRYMKTLIGFIATLDVSCSCDQAFTATVEVSDEVAASDFEELN
jgi:hypothetical protein